MLPEVEFKVVARKNLMTSAIPFPLSAHESISHITAHTLMLLCTLTRIITPHISCSLKVVAVLDHKAPCFPADVWC